MGKNKKAKLNENAESDHSGSEDSDQSMEDANQEVNATFEGRNLEDFDFHGIRQLLLQSFLRAPVDISQLTDLLINQQGVGSVLKQAPEDEDEEESDDDINDDVYGLTTVLNLSAYRETPCVVQVIDYLRKQAEKHADKETLNIFNEVLNRNEKVGLLINERFLNIPAAIAVPMLSSVQDEINRKKKKNPEYDFQKFIMICKTYKYKKEKGESSFANDEEMIFSTNAECSFEYDVAKDCDIAVGGKWKSNDAEILPLRKVLLISANKLPDILAQINTFVQTYLFGFFLYFLSFSYYFTRLIRDN
ncbi:protein BCCIP homolog [Coccinella septempunctata]|uniref:protein BCCIP homolog n=1 Tax=Coccinella septempunctata TaxID=41139 RepID=UPI001D07C6CA|nr:protein BCCIP homolog [Coccinella septempunctata]